jgi:hypothetical protein
MLYAFLCYNNEAVVMSWSQEEDDAVMAKLDVVHEKLRRDGRMGPSLRLMPTSAATTLVKQKDLILDGPYAETKEALLGLYILDCDNLEQAHQIARDLAAANPGGAYEVRPLRLYLQGDDMSKAAP